MSMADSIVLMEKGEIQQVGTPEQIYHEPNNVFAAQFIGTPPMNLLEMENGCRLGYRPEAIALMRVSPGTGYCPAGEIVTREMLGAETHYKVRMAQGDVMVKSLDKGFAAGERVHVCVPLERMFFFDAQGDRLRPGQREYDACRRLMGGA